jgi:hypothetical protein
MTKKKTDTKPKYERPVAELASPRESLKFNAQTIELRKLNEIAELLWLHEDLEDEDRNARVVRTLELYEDIKPSGGAEGMLAAQMVGTHSAALEFLRRAAIPSQSFEGRNMALNQAQKLMTLYTKQLATLDKHRGKGQQKVIVEHVNVEPGGQAIVGHVETGQTKETAESSDAIEHAVNIPLPEVKSKSKASRKRSK